MSSYATTADLYLWGCPANGLLSFTAPQQQAALDGAADVVDGYLRDKYVLPLTGTIAPSLKRACAVIAAYDLLTARGYDPTTGQSEQIAHRYEMTVKWLEQIAKGQISPALTDSTPGGLVGAPTVLQASTQGNGSQTQVSGSSSQSNGGSVVIGPPALRGWK